MEERNITPEDQRIVLPSATTPPLTNVQVDGQNISSFRNATLATDTEEEDEETSPISKQIVPDHLQHPSPDLELAGQNGSSRGDDLNNEAAVDDGLPLKGTVVFVDVRAENENRSKAISREVERLGSVVVPKINSMVTHVVFKEGRNATLCQVKKYPHIHMVSVLWVDACKTTCSRIDESQYSVKFSETEYSPYPAKARRVKSLQPKTLEDDINNSGKKAERRRKRLRCQGKSTGDTPPDNIICFDSGDEYLKSSDLYKLVATPRVVPDTPWILNYINSSPKDRTPGSDVDVEQSADGSFNASMNRNTSFTNIVHRSPVRRKYNSSLLSTSTLPRRLSKDLEESDESFEVISPTQKLNVTNDDTINYSIVPHDVEEQQQQNMLPMEDPNCTNLNGDEQVNGLAVFPVLASSKEISIEKSVFTNSSVNITSNHQTCDEKSVLNDLSVNVTSFISQDKKKKKKKKLLSQSELVPFADSPLAEEVDDRRQFPIQYQKNLQKGNYLNADLAINNVETSKMLQEARLMKLKKQKKHFHRPFLSEDSPNCSFRTTEHLQLRPPNRKKRENVIDKESSEGTECRKLISEMNDLQVVDSDASFNKEDDDDKENNGETSNTTISLTASNNRRSSGVDFKITKKFKSISLTDRTDRTDGSKHKNSKMSTNHTSLLNDDSYREGHMFTSSDDSDDDNESIGSNISFIHDEKEGLVIFSQEDNFPPRAHIVVKKDANADSGISDSGCYGDDIGDEHRKSKNLTRKKLRSSASGVGKSPKVCSRSTRKIFAPYNTSKVKSSLVSTSLHFSEQTFLKAMLKKLGGFVSKTNVSNDTTHVIAGSDRRTLNILYAMVYGCWILSPKWVADSVEEGKWLRETCYEMHKEFPIAKKARVSRVKNGKSFLHTLFTSIPPVYISDATTPPSHELVKLVTLCGGRVTNSVRKAALGVGTINSRRRDLCTVTEKWVLDCITGGEVIATKDYENYIVMGNTAGSPGF